MSRKITEYVIVYAECARFLAGEVQDCITQGWQPRGKIFRDEGWTCQNMVKYEEEEMSINPTEMPFR